MLIRQDSRGRRRAGFTLLEMLIVVAIIVALAGVGGYFLMGALGTSQKDIARTQVKGALTTAVSNYKIRHNDWPDTLQQLTVKDDQGVRYLEPEAILDPWKKEYKYDKAGTKNNGERPDIWTTSPAPENEEIGNWPTLRR